MRKHTDEFKINIKSFGRELDSKLTYQIEGESIELGSEELNSVTPSFQSNILKSAMRVLEIDCSIDIPLGTLVNYKLGTLIDEEYEYLDYGNYIVYSSEKQEDTNSYKIVCYDMMLKSMVEYKELQGGMFPMTIHDYLINLCEDIGLSFQNENEVFPNSDKVIESDLYKNLGYTYRDVFDELAQVTASTICVNENDRIELRYITETNDTIDEEFFSDINVTFGEKYGKINSIVLSRAGESDNVFLQDEESIQENGLCEIKIIDNQIMNFNDRSDYLPDILHELNGLEYYINDFTSPGICYYDICDRYNVQIGETTYSCVMFNDEVNITQGLVEHIYTEMPEESETDYTKADKTDKRINKAYIIVNKQAQQIESVISTQKEQSETLVKVTQDINNIQNLFQVTGGNNLIKDSQWLLGDDVWKKEQTTNYSIFPRNSLYPSQNKYPIEYYYNEPKYIGGYDADLIGKTTSVAKIGVQNGLLETSENNINGLVIGNQYSLSYKVSNSENTVSRVKLIGNGNVIFEKTYNEKINMKEETFSFIAQTNKYTLQVQSTTVLDGFVYIYDLMLNKGDVIPWEPASGEIVGTVLKLSQNGLQIYCTGSEIATLMTAQGFQIRRFSNGTLYEVVTEFTKDGFISKKGFVDEIEIGSFNYKTINYQGYETLILYKEEK